MTVINTSISALIANNAISQNDHAMSSSMEKLATGSRINSAKDDAAGLSISSRMNAQIGGLDMATRNVNDAISLLQTADGATKEISNMLGRLRELAVQSASGTYTDTDRAALDLEYGALMDEINRIALNTKWNGTAILAGGLESSMYIEFTKDITVQVGVDASQTMTMSLNPWVTYVAMDVEMDDAAGTNGDGLNPALGEQQTVTFSDMTANDAFTLAGVTVQATAAVTAANLAAFFGALENDGALGSLTGATVSGALDGYLTSNTILSGNRILFVNTGGRNDSKHLASTDPGTGVDGTDHAVASDLTHPGRENTTAYGTGTLHYRMGRLGVASKAEAAIAVSELEAAINGAAAERAELGSFISRLQHISDNLQNALTNNSASLSRIADTDYAEETTVLARSQIFTQASTAMLAQANQSKQTVLALLR